VRSPDWPTFLAAVGAAALLIICYHIVKGRKARA